MSSDLRSHLWLPVFFPQWKIQGLVPPNAHFPLGQRCAEAEPAVHRCVGWCCGTGQAQSTPETLQGTFLKVFFTCCPLMCPWFNARNAASLPPCAISSGLSELEELGFSHHFPAGFDDCKKQSTRSPCLRGCQGAIKAHMAQTGHKSPVL